MQQAFRRIPVGGWFCLALVAWVAAGAWWWAAHRSGQPLNIDEAGYLSFALNDAQSAERSGAQGWVRTVLWPGAFGPVVPAVASVLVLGGVELTRAGAVVGLASAGVTLLVTWLLARRTVGRTAWLAPLLVASAPAFIAMSRMFGFGVPGAALTTVALYALVRSRSHASWVWSLAFGVALGVMPLTRTMLVAFVPVLAVAGLCQVVGAPDGRPRRALRWAVSLLVAAAVAATWLVASWRPVFDYLVGFGYGSKSAEYRHDGDGVVAGPLFLTLRGVLIEWFVPLTLIIGLGLVLGLAAFVVVLRRRRAPWLRGVVQSAAFPPVVLLLGGGAALASSQNGGSGFTLVLLPAAAVLAVRGWVTVADVLRLDVTVRRVAAGAVSLVCILVMVGWHLGTAPLGTHRSMDLPLLGDVPVTDGELYYEPGTFPPSRGLVNSPDRARAWAEAHDELAELSMTDAGTARPVALGFRGVFVNTNTVALTLQEATGAPVLMAQIDPSATQGGVEDYQAWLDGPAAATCVLLTSPGDVNEYPPVVDTDALEQAADESGFTSVGTVPLPDGRTVTVWERDRADCAA